MKRILPVSLLFLCLITTNLYSQKKPPLPYYQDAKIYFNYDNAGNQTKKYFKYVYTKKQQKALDSTQVIIDLDLPKNEVISQLEYYPNPIKDELTINWINSIDSHIISLHVYTINYKLLKVFKPIKGVTQYDMQFNNFASGVYIVKALFNNGEQDTFKVIKK